MFKNPGEKIGAFVKVMFWFLSILYVLFAIISALFNTVLVAGVAGLSSAASKYTGMNGSGTGTGAAIMVIWIWVFTIVSIPIVILVLYQIALFFLMFAGMSKDIEVCKDYLQEMQYSGPAQDEYPPQQNMYPMNQQFFGNDAQY